MVDFSMTEEQEVNNLSELQSRIEDLIISIEMYQIGDFRTNVDTDPLVDEFRKIVDYLMECEKNPEVRTGCRIGKRR